MITRLVASRRMSPIERLFQHILPPFPQRTSLAGYDAGHYGFAVAGIAGNDITERRRPAGLRPQVQMVFDLTAQTFDTVKGGFADAADIQLPKPDSPIRTSSTGMCSHYCQSRKSVFSGFTGAGPLPDANDDAFRALHRVDANLDIQTTGVDHLLLKRRYTLTSLQEGFPIVASVRVSQTRMPVPEKARMQFTPMG